MRSMNQGKLEIIKQETECLNIVVLGVSELKWTGMRHFQSDNYKVFYSGNDQIKRNALILKYDTAQAPRGYNGRSN